MANTRVYEWSTTAASNTDINSNNIAEGCAPSGINNAIRELMRQVRIEVANQGSDIASAGTTDIGAATGQYVKVTGTTTITSFGTVNAGTSRWVEFTGALTLTHNATSLILEGGANYTTSAGDMIFAVSEGSGNWRVRIFPASGKPITPSTNGKHKLWIPSSAMLPNTVNGPASAQTIASDVVYYTLDFDSTTNELAQFTLSMPSSWDEGTVTFRPVWTAASGSGGVVWKLFGIAIGDDDTLTAGVGTGQTSTDTLITAGDLHRGPESSAITISGTPAANDTVFFVFLRTPGDASDTLAVDARLIGIELYFTTNEAVDVAT